MSGVGSARLRAPTIPVAIRAVCHGDGMCWPLGQCAYGPVARLEPTSAAGATLCPRLRRGLGGWGRIRRWEPIGAPCACRRTRASSRRRLTSCTTAGPCTSQPMLSPASVRLTGARHCGCWSGAACTSRRCARGPGRAHAHPWCPLMGTACAAAAAGGEPDADINKGRKAPGFQANIKADDRPRGGRVAYPPPARLAACLPTNQVPATRALGELEIHTYQELVRAQRAVRVPHAVHVQPVRRGGADVKVACARLCCAARGRVSGERAWAMR